MHIKLTIRYNTVIKDQLACVASSHSELVQLGACRESIEMVLNNKRGNTFRPLLGRRLCIYHKGGRNRPVGDPI